MLAQATLGHFIDGAVVDGNSERNGPVYDPATGQITKSVAFGSAGDVDAAVSAARSAFPAWAAKPPLQRAAVLFRFREVFVRDAERLARIITAEHGKTLGDAAGELQRGLEVVEFACGIPHLLKGEFSENVGTVVDSHSVRQPLGICAGISPFNFPAMGAHVDVPHCDCVRQYVCHETERERPLALHGACGIVAGGRTASRRVQCGERRQNGC